MASKDGESRFSLGYLSRNRDLSNRIPGGRAKGPDGVTDLVWWSRLKKVSINRPEILRDIFNTRLRGSVFPHSWKVAKRVLPRKGDKPLDNPSSYRPICLLKTTG